MATIYWRGDAPAVAQVSTLQITAYDATTAYNITINGKTVSVLGTTDAPGTATALAAACAASTIPEFLEVTWTAASDVVKGTAATAGVPFTYSKSVTGGTGTMGSVTAATVSSGPYDASTAANYSGGSLPINGDTINIDGNSPILYGLTALASNTTLTINIADSFIEPGRIGLPLNNAAGYIEYRPRYLQIAGGTVNVGKGNSGSAGARLIQIDTQSIAATIAVLKSSSPINGVNYAVNLIGSNSSNVLNIFGGSVALAPDSGTASQFSSVGIVPANGQSVEFFASPTATLATVSWTGGQITLGCAATTVSAYGGTAFHTAGAVTTMNIGMDNSGSNPIYQYLPAATIATLNVGRGTIDFSESLAAKTVTNCNVYQGATINDPQQTVTWSNAIVMKNCRPISPDCTLNIGATRNILPS